MSQNRAYTKEYTTGTLIFPTPRKVKPEPIPERHCELCAAVFGKATCQAGQYDPSHIHVLHNEITTYIAAAHFEGATLYSFSVLAQLDSTMFEHAAATAQQALAHLRGSTPF